MRALQKEPYQISTSLIRTGKPVYMPGGHVSFKANPAVARLALMIACGANQT